MNSATSASTACCNNSRAPLRNTSVSASATGSATPGFRYSIKLSSFTAYSSLAIRLMVLEKTHQEYATSFIRSYTTFELNSVQTFATVNTLANEAYSIQVFDGAGRIFGAASDHPASAGGYVMAYQNYDVMGRVVQQSNPTEVNNSWVPTGDDASGIYSTQQTYDWKGRPLLTTQPDGNTIQAVYGGCGCAGGEVTTLRDQQGRRRKFTKDVLGRLKQVDELNWDESVYSTTSYTYNGRDQIAGSNQAGQTRSFVYDGYGRLQTRTTPEQGTTSYSYFADDTTQTITDARGATTTLAYNNRQLVTGITY